MKKLLAYSLLATFVAYGCQVKEVIENTQESQPEAKVFTAVIEDNTSGDTKTSLDGEGNVLWKQGDQVSIFAGSTVNEQYQVSDASDGKTAATLNKVGGGGFVAGTEIDNNVAFYPYASTAEIAKSGSNYVISEIELPATQNYAAGSFGNGAFPMVAVTSSTEDMNLKFKNILGGLKLQLKGTATIASITITGKNNEKLYGEAEVTVAYGGTPSISLTNADAKTVTLDCGAGVTLNTETATPFIIALPPITMTGGFTVLVTDSEGKQMEISTSKSQTIPRSSLLRMPVVDYVGTPVGPDYLNEPFTITSTGSTSVSIIKSGSPDDIILEYKKGLGDWMSYSIGSSIDLTDGESLQFRAGEGGNTTLSTSGANWHIVSIDGTGTVDVSGNIMSLLDKSLQKNDLAEFCFTRLFYNCTKLVNSSNLKLPVTSLPRNCYGQMFMGCTSLTTAPSLPATSLGMACYSSMFSGCTSLTSAPSLPATSLAQGCYSSMFSGCTSLTTTPSLPATSLATRCYYEMFKECTGLTTASDLPATIMQNLCYYNMFNGCTLLATVPSSLPATSLATSCYQGMFSGCTSLTSAPSLPATSLAQGCYVSMFSGCTLLTTAPSLPATSLAESCYSSMFSQCTSLETAPSLPATSLAESCYSNMFSQCTSLETAPSLPATSLEIGCYSSMFYGCTSLTTAPDLPATTLRITCYSSMFNGCSNLNYIKMLATDISPSQCVFYWVENVSNTGTFVKSSSATWDVIGVHGVPSGWTILTE